MATTAADPVFLDTNILIYAKTALSPFHAAAVAKLTALTTATHPLWVSRQTFREYLAVMSRPSTLTAPVPMATLSPTSAPSRRNFSSLKMVLS